ncbi:NADH-quinone oxidoreductase subunit M [Prochlorothrix hollandica]|uniref:NAD(P)H-quinone oxidoreductase subunit D4 n=1 Tax=Prochlorothrix hollandica PCC 9006 = CALU 1027 TaxID=317619 RepID=A0A0M2PYP6_PROHO|nr:NADH-quinone oxidoreductase subunit M [Prochlorothrix hollandica]KKJ01556.1 NAD(P)H-quinone oxidoreductase subunit D4 [Prochlorothrix hollandica PCC 9006 = CALU 1027]
MLSALIWIPVGAAIVIGLLPNTTSAGLIRSGAGFVSMATLAVAILLLFQFNPQDPGFQFQENLSWLEALGLRYSLGVDGIALPLVMLNVFLIALVIYCTSATVQRPKLYYSLLLLISGGVTGAFLAQDFILFFLFYEVELVPLYLLIAIWGGLRRGYAATKFLIYTALSGVLLLLAFLGLNALTSATSFAYDPALSQLLPLGPQVILLLLVIAAFAIKVPLFPFHTWLPDAHVEASTPVSMLLAGVLLKLGTYGLLRFGVVLFPDGWHLLGPGLAIWAVVSTLYGSLNAIVQKDMKKMVAYSSIGHMGYILLALAAATPISLMGAVMQMISHGLISALLFLLVGFVYSRTGTRDLSVLRGLLNPERGLPLVGSLMIVGAMASSGLPGLMGFVAEFMIFRGSFPVFPVATLLCLIGTGLTSVYFLLLINRAFFGRLTEQFAQLPRVELVEHLPGLVLSLLIVVFGIQPQWLVNWSAASTLSLSASVARTSGVNPAPESASPAAIASLSLPSGLDSAVALISSSTVSTAIGANPNVPGS